jgi:hypothetical protein
MTRLVPTLENTLLGSFLNSPTISDINKTLGGCRAGSFIFSNCDADYSHRKEILKQ